MLLSLLHCKELQSHIYILMWIDYLSWFITFGMIYFPFQWDKWFWNISFHDHHYLLFSILMSSCGLYSRPSLGARIWDFSVCNVKFSFSFMVVRREGLLFGTGTMLDISLRILRTTFNSFQRWVFLYVRTLYVLVRSVPCTFLIKPHNRTTNRTTTIRYRTVIEHSTVWIS